ncbi:MAG: TonB-dependent receptor [Opitutus sp.]|nr:TonB-dependent receptor [Opitutus sp.]
MNTPTTPATLSPISLRCPRRFAFAVAIALGFAVAASLHGQSASGAITGTVINSSTSAYLEGAEVTVVGTRNVITTDRNGLFSLRDLAPGEVQLAIVYPGVPRATLSVQVLPGQTATPTLRLGSEIVQLDEFRVSGTREGMAKAIALQKAASDSRIVAAGDQFGDIFNGNVADYLKFLPGVGLDYSADDARALSLRGLSPSLTTVTMDNNPVASASSGGTERRFEFEQISVSNIETVEVFKTLTPDKPATNAGGSVNLVTKSAFDRRDTLFRYRVFFSTPGERHATQLKGISPVTGERTTMTRPNAELDLTMRLRENLGFYIGLRNYENIRMMERSAYVYSFNPATGGLPTDPAPTEWNFYTDYAINTRRSASGRVDWRAGPKTVVSVGGSWNWFDMPWSHHLYAIIVGNHPTLALGQTPVHTVSAGSTNGVGRLLNRMEQKRKAGTTYTSNASLKHEFGAGLKLTSDIYWNKADNRYSDITEGYFGQIDSGLASVTINLTNLGALVPGVTMVAGGVPVRLNDNSRFSVSRMFTLPRSAWDTRQGVAADLSKLFETARIPFTAQVGVRQDSKLRTSEQFNRRTPVDPTVPAGAGMLALTDAIWSAAPAPLGQPGTVAWINMKRAYELYGRLPLQTYDTNALPRFDETVKGAYARFDLRPTKGLLVVTGVRHEEITSKNENRFLRAVGRFSHRDNYFSLNAKYALTPNHLFRAATAQSTGLPNYGDLLPSTLTITEPTPTGARGRVSLTNPALRPYEITNYDLGYEYHFGRSGMLGASLFQKDFRNYIVQATRSLTRELADELQINDGSLSGAPSDYDVVTRFNVAEPGRYRGLELMYSQTLGFLPAPLNTLGVQANATFIDVGPIVTQQVLVAGNPEQNRALLEQVRHSLELDAVTRQYNLALNWRRKGFSAMLSFNHAGKTLRGISRSDVRYTGGALTYINTRTHMKPRTTVDLRMEYSFSRRIVPFVQIRNLFNAPFENTQNGFLLNRQDYLDPRLEFGLRGTW